MMFSLLNKLNSTGTERKGSGRCSNTSEEQGKVYISIPYKIVMLS